MRIMHLAALILVSLLLIGLAMAAVTPGREQVEKPAEPAQKPVLDLNFMPESTVPDAADQQAGPSASELAPDAEADPGAEATAPDQDPAGADPRMPGPALKPSPQYPDHIPPQEREETTPADSDDDDALPVRHVMADRLNLRAGPGTDHAVIGSVTRNQPVTPIAAVSNGWVHVRLANGDEGWLADEYLSAP